MVGLVPCSMAEDGLQVVGHRPVWRIQGLIKGLIKGQILYSMLRDRSPYIQCYKPRDMQQAVLKPLDRSMVALGVHTVVMVEGKEQK